MTIKIPPHLIVAASSWISRGISVVIQIISIRYLLNILGTDGYAIFVLLTGLFAWASLSDFGIGHSLLNYIAESRALGEKYSIYIFSSGLFCFIVFVFLSFILWFISGYLSSLYLNSFVGDIIIDKKIVFFTAMLIYIMAALGGIIYKIWFAEQIGWLSNIVPAISSFIGLILLVAVNYYDYSLELNKIFLLFIGPSAIAALFLYIIRCVKSYNKNEISKIFFILKKLVRRASGFWIFSVLGTLVLQADYIVLSQKIEPESIIIYSTLMKLFGIIMFVYSALLQALWPVCTELRVRAEWTKLRTYVNNYIIFGILFVGLCSFLFFIFQSVIIKLILPSFKLEVSWFLVILFCVYFILRVWSDTYAMLLQSMNYLKPLWFLVPIQAIFSFVLQWQLAGYFGLYGMLIGLIASFLLTVVVVLPIVFNRKIKQLEVL